MLLRVMGITMVSKLAEHKVELVLDLAHFRNSTDDGADIEADAGIVLPFRLRSGVRGSCVPISIRCRRVETVV
jgi:hypothetical protein